jgi:hypothetical protein
MTAAARITIPCPGFLSVDSLLVTIGDLRQMISGLTRTPQVHNASGTQRENTPHLALLQEKTGPQPRFRHDDCEISVH